MYFQVCAGMTICHDEQTNWKDRSYLIWFCDLEFPNQHKKIAGIKHPSMLVPGHTLELCPSTSFHGKQRRTCQHFTGFQKAAMSLWENFGTGKEKLHGWNLQQNKVTDCISAAGHVPNVSSTSMAMAVTRPLVEVIKYSHQTLFSFAHSFLVGVGGRLLLWVGIFHVSSQSKGDLKKISLSLSFLESWIKVKWNL